MKIVIIDDEYSACDILRHMLTIYCEDIEIVGSAHTVAEGTALLKDTDPDLVFLDVELPDGTGFDLLTALDVHPFCIIFTTAYDQYALQAIKHEALDYLIKPFSIDELRAALEKAKSRGDSKADLYTLTHVSNSLFGSGHEKMVVPERDRLTILLVSDILYYKADGNYTEIHTIDGRKVVSSNTLKSYDEKMSDYRFYRIHQSFLVNLEQVHVINRGKYCSVVMSNGDELEVARARKKGLMDVFGG